MKFDEKITEKVKERLESFSNEEIESIDVKDLYYDLISQYELEEINEELDKTLSPEMLEDLLKNPNQW